MKKTYIYHSYHSFFSEISDFFPLEKRIVFLTSNEKLGTIDKEKKEKEKSIGEKAVEMHKRAEKHKKQVEKSPLRKFIDTNPDPEVIAADEDRNREIANVIKEEDHKKISALLMGNIPAEVGEKISGNLMNDYN